MKRYIAALSLLLGVLPSLAVLPQPPRNGPHSVQMMVGGTNRLPMCIVPPRALVDGTPIPPGTRCIIVIYRSLAQGKENTYDHEVGRAEGEVTRPDDLQPWIDVTAAVTPEDPHGGVFYLASSAIIDGQESDLNSQWLTIRWAPGEFEPVEYPAAGAFAGLPPSRRAPMAAVGPMVYPEWVWSTAGDAYDWQLPRTTGLGARPTVRFTLSGTTAQGAVQTAQLVTDLQARVPGAAVSFPRNQFTGTVANGLLVGRLTLTVALQGKKDGQTVNERADTDVEVSGALSPQAAIEGGTGQGSVVQALAGKPTVTKPFDARFVARLVPGERPQELTASQASQAPLGMPGPSFRLPAYASDPLFGAGHCFARSLQETIKMHLGDTRLLTHGETPDAVGGYLLKSPPRRAAGDQVDWLCAPESVATSERVGDSIRVRAAGNGVAEVWAATLWEYTGANGEPRQGRYKRTWLILVGDDAAAAYDASLGLRPSAPIAADPGPISAGKVTGYVRGPDGKPLPGAQVFLVFESTGKTYQSESWVSRNDGTFTLDLSKEASGYGLKEGRYQVMPFKRREDPSGLGPGNDYWPHPRTRPVITITRDLAKAGPIVVPGQIWMDLVSRMTGG